MHILKIIFLHYSQTVKILLYFRLFSKYCGKGKKKDFGLQGPLQDHQKEGLESCLQAGATQQESSEHFPTTIHTLATNS